MNRIRVLVVDDSRFMVGAISAILGKAADLEVVGFALDGEDAIEQARALKPDVITMDVNMPRVDGIEATRIISKQLNIPVLVLSAHTQQGTNKAMEALEAGASDYMTKPSGELSMDLEKVSAQLIDKVRSVAARGLRGAAPELAAGAITSTGQFRAITQPLFATSSTTTGQLRSSATTGERAGLNPGASSRQPAAPSRARSGPPKLLVIGASAGGVPVLSSFLPKFTATIPFPILVVQHFPEGFSSTFVARLKGLCSIPVVDVTNDMQLVRGTIYVTPGGYNVEMTPFHRLRLSQDTGPAVFRPSIDVAMRSVAQVVGAGAAAVILTGMGRDGSLGVRAISDSGGLVLVQDPSTATAYGMPKAAIETGCANVILPPDQLAATLMLLASGGRTL